MKKAWIIAVVLLGGVAVGLLSCKREPRYAGESYSYWFTQFYTSGHNGRNDPADREEALFALRKMGTNVYPLLLKEYFSTKKGTKFGEISYELTRLVLGNKRDFPPYIKPEKIHDEAAYAFRKIGPSTQTLLPLLSKELGPETNKYLGALFLLGCVGENREQAVPLLTKALKHPDAWTRSMALQSLTWLEESADAALPELLALFEGAKVPDPSVIVLLGNIGSSAKDAASKMEKLCAGTNGLQFRAAVALYQIDPANKTALGVLTNLAAAGPREFDDIAWDMASALGDARKIPIQFIHPLTNSSRDATLTWTIMALQKNSPQAAADVLMDLLKTEKQNTQLWAAGWLLRIDRNHLPARAFILNHLENQKRETIWDEFAIQQLGEASSDAKEIISLLNLIAKENSDEKLQRAARKALKRIKIREQMRKEGWKDHAPYQ